jgi:hypothetical protein
MATFIISNDLPILFSFNCPYVVIYIYISTEKQLLLRPYSVSLLAVKICLFLSQFSSVLSSVLHPGNYLPHSSHQNRALMQYVEWLPMITQAKIRTQSAIRAFVQHKLLRLYRRDPGTECRAMYLTAWNSVVVPFIIQSVNIFDFSFHWTWTPTEKSH